MPDTSVHAYRFAVLLGLLIFVVMGSTYMSDYARLLADPDTLWHVKLGSDIMASGQLPVVDTYSYTFAGHSFISKEWLSEIIFACAFNTMGWSGVMLVASLIVVSTILVLYHELAKYLQPTVAGLGAILIITMLGPIVLARPHLFTMPIAVYFTARIFRAAEAKQAPQFWLLALIALWSNLHGSFTLGFVAATFAFLHLIENIRFTDKPLLVKWMIFLALCPVAAMIHPYGFEPIQVGLQMMATNKVMAYIQEWMPLNSQEDFIIEYFILVSLIGLIGARLKLGWAKTIFIVFVLHMLLTHVRFVYVYFLLVPIVVVPHVAERFPEVSLSKWLTRPRDIVERFAAKYFVPLATLIGIGAFVVGFVFFETKKPMPPQVTFAEKPIAFALANKLDGPVFNEYLYGGTLIFHGIKTFVDGRAEQLFTGDFFPDYVNSDKPNGAQLFQDIINRNHITWTLLPVASTRNSFLEKMGWKKAYSDENSVIYTKPTS